MWEGGIRVPMIVAGPGISANSQCDQPVAQWDYLHTLHDLSDTPKSLPDDLDGISLRPVLEKGNAGKLACRDTGLVFHFPAHYTVPITSYRDGDYKLMRHLNTGEVKLFNVAEDMGESKDLAQTMPDKVEAMTRKLDAYLKKVGAWEMEEVYQTRQEELETWVEKDKEEAYKLTQRLTAKGVDEKESKRLKAALSEAKRKLKHHQGTLQKLAEARSNERWF